MKTPEDQKPIKTLKVKGARTIRSNQIKTKYSQLTDEDISFAPGQEKDLIKRVEDRLNNNRDVVIRIIEKTHGRE